MFLLGEGGLTPPLFPSFLKPWAPLDVIKSIFKLFLPPLPTSPCYTDLTMLYYLRNKLEILIDIFNLYLKKKYTSIHSHM